MAGKKDINLILSVDAKGAIKSVKQFGKEIDVEAGKASKSIGGIEAALVSVGSIVALGQLKNQIIGLADEAAFAKQSMKVLADVTTALGQSGDEAVKAAYDLSDAMFSEFDAAVALRNLLSSGLDIPKAVKLLDTLKNSAAANRKASMSLADQIISTTEGIRNQNSVLTDNSGITKNVGAILKDYAKATGKSIAQLDRFEQAQAIANGFIEEGAVFLGQYEKQLDGYIGAQGAATKAIRDMRIEIGEALQPILADYYDGLTEGAERLAEFAEAHDDFVRRLAGGVTAVGLFAGAAGLGLLLKRLNPIVALLALAAEQVGELSVELMTRGQDGLTGFQRALATVEANLEQWKVRLKGVISGELFFAEDELLEREAKAFAETYAEAIEKYLPSKIADAVEFAFTQAEEDLIKRFVPAGLLGIDPDKIEDEGAKAFNALANTLKKMADEEAQAAIELQRYYAEVVLGIRTDTLAQFKVLAGELDKEARRALEKGAEEWSETVIEEALDTLRKLRPEPITVPVEFEFKDEPIEDPWQGPPEKGGLGKTVTQKLLLLVEADTGVAEDAMGALGVALHNLADEADIAGNVVSNVLVSALKSMQYSLESAPEGQTIKKALTGGVWGAVAGGLTSLVGAFDFTGDAAKRTARGIEEAGEAFRVFNQSIQDQTLESLRGQRHELQIVADNWHKMLADFEGHSDKAMGPFVEEWGWLLDKLGIPRTRHGMRKLGEMIAAVDDALADFETFNMDTLTGQLEALRFEFDLFDVESPIEKWRRLREAVADVTGVELPDLDLRTAEGRRRMEQLLAYMSGLQEIPDTLARDLGLSREALLQLLSQLRADENLALAQTIERLLDEFDKGLGGIGGKIDDETDEIRVSRQVTITEMQGAALVTNTARTAYAVEGLYGLARGGSLGLASSAGAMAFASPLGRSSQPQSVVNVDVGGITVQLSNIASEEDAIRYGGLAGEEITEVLTKAIRGKGGSMRGGLI